MEKTIRLERELAYTGTILKVYRDTVVANGIQETYDYIHHDGAAAVLPVTKEGKLLMVRQYRNALDRFTLELPAGKVDAPDEPRIECAYRELEEETGFKAETMEYLMTINTTVAFCDEAIDLFVARDLVKTEQHLDADESIDVEEWSLSPITPRRSRPSICASTTTERRWLPSWHMPSGKGSGERIKME